MVRMPLMPLLAVLSLAGCGLPESLERTFSGDEDAPPASCEGVQCGPCAPAITVRVAGAPGLPPPEVTLAGIGGNCGASVQSVTVCSTDVHAPGDYAFEVQAPGYQPAALQVTVPRVVRVGACCDCGYEARVVDVTLEPR